MIRCISICEPNSYRRNTLQGTNISPKNGILKMIFLFPRWDMLVPWRVYAKSPLVLTPTGSRKIPDFCRLKKSGEFFSPGAQVKGAWTQKPKMAMAKCSKSRKQRYRWKRPTHPEFLRRKMGGGMDDGCEPKRRILMVDGSGIFTDPWMLDFYDKFLETNIASLNRIHGCLVYLPTWMA